MKKYLVVILFLMALPVAAETMTQCVINCPPGNNSCTQCCTAQFEASKGPCYDGCQTAQKSCFDQAWQSCKNDPNPQYCYMRASQPCQQAIFSCQRACDGSVQIPGGCPGEVPPQKCPYDCQMWNPASQSCIGPTMNGCPPMQASLANTIDDLHAATATADAEKATAHVADLKAKSAVKSKVKGKKKK